ncbi:MAG TPA: LCP family protein [Actinomycetota bacterium]|nr:LCP family protein [Actinomycetota bacterium]
MIRRALLLLTVVAVTVGLVASSGTSTAAPLLMGRLHASFQPTSGKVFILVIGNDARSGNPTYSRADAIHIVGINTDTMEAGILNFPRDSWVNIPGYGHGKMNEALYHGGPELLARTLQGITGITLDYWAMVGFEDFRKIIKALGGVRMHLPTSVHDPSGSGARLNAGTQNLGPHQALAYLRTRHSFSGGDITRTTNQGHFLIALLKKLRRQVDRSPAAMLRWMAITQRFARYEMSSEEMFRLGVLAAELRPRDVRNVTVPVSVGSVGAASVVFISPGATSLYARLRESGSL